MAAMIFYERAIPLNRERHQSLKVLHKQNDFGFAAKTNSLLLAGSELAEAARDYPVVFVGNAEGPFTLAALVGLESNRNLFVDAQGNWSANTYLPAFARRYPFVLAGVDGSDDLTVCIDEASPWLGAVEGEALFDAAGKETPYLNSVLDFLRLFHNEMTRTRAFGSKLQELGLLVPKVISVDREGQKQQLEGLWVVDETRLAGLSDEQGLSLLRSGYLGWIYAHLLSLGNVARLARKMDELRLAA
ncbi:SapC family protein [Lacisediminimonas sp.]|uniref:SapC family protein n=1 Tax=Lacisediminimonas sp. TaxID=3060582 RepID=UPI002720E265|nr:SapC family protein [Lacisediminimonas sp.]MDO8299945.1 SapC family protein [Lacisediminimonas sp.]